MRRVATLVSMAAAVMFVAASVSAHAPNFSGKWTRDLDKSPMPAAPAGGAAGGGGGARGGGRAGGGDMTIAQDAKTLTITRTQGGNEVKTVYNLDGSESKNTTQGRNGAQEVVSMAKWDGDTLVITQKGANGDTTIKYSMDGADLKVETQRPAGQNGPTPAQVVEYKPVK